MIQKLVFSALVVMMSTAAFAVEDARDGRDAHDQARANLDAQHQADKQTQQVDKTYLGAVAQYEATSGSQGGAVASKVFTDDKLSALPGVKQFAIDISINAKAGMSADEARVAALSKVRTGLTEEEFIKACGE